MFNVEVDQSGKIERTRVNTVLAFSDGREYSILILAVEKRECIRKLRQWRENDRMFYLKLFVAALFLLLKDYLDQLDVITIDMEYPGKEAEIRAMLLRHIWKVKHAFTKEQIVFQRIGKKSPAHRKALAVYRGIVKTDRKVRARDLLQLLR